MVIYTETTTENVYNLGFGDYDEKTSGINDLNVTNNGDSLKVLATVASTVYAFIEKHPNAWILATGSTSVRTRLYRMGITNNLAEIELDFIILGYNKNEQWESFLIGEDYEAFLITKRNN
jgi:ribonucleotide monophosphatase NagD (HAD superfamily)